MTPKFVWFDNIGPARSATTDFLAKTLEMTPNDIGPMTFLGPKDGMPYAAVCEAMEDISGWVPYVEVSDLPAAVDRATADGATVIARNLDGPAGTATFIKDPGGAPLALWKRGASA